MTHLRTRPVTAMQLARREVRALLGSRYKPGQRLPPIKTLAKMLGTGQTNTQRAVQQLVAEGLLLARPSAGTVVCDDVEPVDPLPTYGIANRIGALIYGDSQHQFAEFRDQLRHGITRAGAQCRLVPSGISHFMDHVKEQVDADFVVLVNPHMDVPIARTRQPLLVLSTAASLNIAPDATCDVISVDSRHGGWLAGRHLQDAGLDEICFVGRRADVGDGYDTTSHLRLSGCEEGFGRPVAQGHRLYVDAYMPSRGALAAAEYSRLPCRPKGVFCASDDIAVGFVMGAHAFGLHPARDYHLVGFDGQKRGRELMDGPLTTIALPVTQMCAAALQWIIERAAQPTRPHMRLQVTCKLFQGATTAAPSGPRSR